MDTHLDPPSSPSSQLDLCFPDPTHTQSPSSILQSIPPPRPDSPLTSDMFSNLSSTAPPNSISSLSSPPLDHHPSPNSDRQQSSASPNPTPHSTHSPSEADPDADWTLLSQYSSPFASAKIGSLHEQPPSDLDMVHSQSAASHPPPVPPAIPPPVPPSSTPPLQPSSDAQPHDPAIIQCQQWLSNLPLADVLCNASIDADQDASDPDQAQSMSASRNYAPSQILSDLGPDDSLSVVCGRPIVDRQRTITQRLFSTAHASQTAPLEEISHHNLTPHPVSIAQARPPPTFSDATRPTPTRRAIASVHVPPTLAETPLDFALDPCMDLSSSYLHPAVLPSPKTAPNNLDTQLPLSGPVATQSDPPTQAEGPHGPSTQELLESAVDPLGPLIAPSLPSNNPTDPPPNALEPRNAKRPGGCLRLVLTASMAALVALAALWLQWRWHPDQLDSTQTVLSILSPPVADLEHPTPFQASANASLATCLSETLSSPGPKNDGPPFHDSGPFSTADAQFPTAPSPPEYMPPMAEFDPSLPTAREEESSLVDPQPNAEEPLSDPSSALLPSARDHPSPMASQPTERSSPAPASAEHGNHRPDDEHPPGPDFSIPWGFILVGLCCCYLPRLVKVNTEHERQDGPRVDYLIALLEAASEDEHTSQRALSEALSATACEPRELKRLTEVLERRMRADVYTRIELGLLAWASGARGDEAGSEARWRRFWSEDGKVDGRKPGLSALVEDLGRGWAAGRASLEAGGPGDEGGQKQAVSCGPPPNARRLKGRSSSPAVSKPARLKKSSSPAPSRSCGRAGAGVEDESGSDDTVLPTRRARKKAAPRATGGVKPLTRARHSEPAKLVVVKQEEEEDDEQQLEEAPVKKPATTRRSRASDVHLQATTSNTSATSSTITTTATRSSPRIRSGGNKKS